MRWGSIKEYNKLQGNSRHKDMLTSPSDAMEVIEGVDQISANCARVDQIPPR